MSISSSSSGISNMTETGFPRARGTGFEDREPPRFVAGVAKERPVREDLVLEVEGLDIKRRIG